MKGIEGLKQMHGMNDRMSSSSLGSLFQVDPSQQDAEGDSVHVKHASGNPVVGHHEEVRGHNGQTSRALFDIGQVRVVV